jgi:hypothetical protein
VGRAQPLRVEPPAHRRADAEFLPQGACDEHRPELEHLLDLDLDLDLDLGQLGRRGILGAVASSGSSSRTRLMLLTRRLRASRSSVSARPKLWTTLASARLVCGFQQFSARAM